MGRFVLSCTLARCDGPARISATGYPPAHTPCMTDGSFLPSVHSPMDKELGCKQSS